MVGQYLRELSRLSRVFGLFVASLCVAVAVSVTVMTPAPVYAAGSGPVAVVVHPKVKTTGLKRNELANLLLGERRFWSGRLRVTLLIPAPGARERKVFVQDLCKMTEPQFRQYWIGMVFRGKATSSPKVTYNNVMAGQLVRVIPGALALIAVKDVKPGMKVLKIDGKAPGDPGYPLK